MLDSDNIPYIKDEKFVYACGFVFYSFDQALACNNPLGTQHLNLSISDIQRLIKRQIRKAPLSLNKPFWRTNPSDKKN
jgi:hypothetical protein